MNIMKDGTYIDDARTRLRFVWSGFSNKVGSVGMRHLAPKPC
jgi:hypothetical protein